jgi:hypothetical protein
MSRILPVRTGWAPAPADTAFYPHDLPEDWRLTYFANVLSAVLLDSAAWRQADPGVLEQWCSDVPASFGFYLRIPGAGVERADLAEVQGLLGDRFGGWVGGGERNEGLARLPRGVPPGPVYVPIESPAAAEHSPARALACVVPDGVETDLRAARAWLEALASGARGRPALALMGAAEFEEVQRWQSLCQLLGVG